MHKLVNCYDVSQVFRSMRELWADDVVLTDVEVGKFWKLSIRRYLSKCAHSAILRTVRLAL